MSIWFIINIIIFCIAWGKILLGYHGIHMAVGGLALTFILYNWTRHAVFSTIRSPRVTRKRKIALAQLSKRVLTFHKWTGSTALVIALLHITLVVHRFGFHINQLKFLSGLLTIILLILLVAAGWLRWYHTTVIRRYTHWVLAFLVIFSALFHLFM